MSWTRYPGPLRVMYYCHDTFGLGHLRRTLTLAHHLRHQEPPASQLLVTGSPVAHEFVLPDGSDYIKLPSVVKVGPERYAPRSVATSFGRIRDLRSEILLNAARHFEPDVLVVDHAPAGLDGEILAALRYLQADGRARLVLGLRDIVDEPARVRRVWQATGVYELLDDVYDRILVYGQRDVHDAVREYGFSARAAGKTRFVGYLRREPGRRRPAEVRSELGLQTDRLVVVTAGGGGDGYALLQTMLQALRQRRGAPPFDSLLVTGPLMSAPEQASLRRLAEDLPAVRVATFRADLADMLGAADVVVSMGGYNAVCEVLSLHRPAVIVPRVHPRREQWIRAQALGRRKLVRPVDPQDLTPARLLAAIEAELHQPSRPHVPLNMEGLVGFAAEVQALLRWPIDARMVASAGRAAPTWMAAGAARPMAAD